MASYSLLWPFQLLIFEPMYLLLSKFSAILLVWLHLWQTGLAFIEVFCGMIFAPVTDPIWHCAYNRVLELDGGVSKLEFRLVPAIFGALLIPAAIFWFVWSAYPWVHGIVSVLGSAVFGMGTLLVCTSIFIFVGKLANGLIPDNVYKNVFLVDAYLIYAASATNSFAQPAFAAAFPLSVFGCITHY
ncbi:uncharacterized protein BCR38DRAFT_485410 [Pseudomassariella vexata]|uniref:Uncharacterized protein n=1 Tax=Pseudomassariella vexata TaxID=1141098 RepID=A0A1Y2DY96_9PEZI|nr:uncharacterized protein BCR38DRAFT_485410 [Pseudomassariella vexata]ORY64272.1 hypothetical protein BCR38DRAFT_485410 [Pseudomassariella vexata]